MQQTNRERLDTASQPQDEFVIDDLETLRVFSDPFRARIVELLWGPPKPVKQLATELQAPVTKLYYHMKLLHQHGLIRVVDTQLISGIEEKQYQARAWFYPIDPKLLSAAQHSEGLDQVLQQAFDQTKQDIRRTIQSGVIEGKERNQAGSLLLRKSGRRLTADQAQRFYDRLAQLVAEFDAEASPPDDTEGIRYRILVSLYPTNDESSESDDHAAASRSE